MYRTKLTKYNKYGIEEAKAREYFARACLRFVGNDEFYGQPVKFEQWQLDNIWYPIFAHGHLDENGEFIRKYRRALIGIPRGVGKTVISCMMLLSEATMNPVYRGQYGLIADSKENAQNAYQTLAAMVRTSPELSKEWVVYEKEIKNLQTGAWIRTFPNKVAALQGWHFNMAICDEVHVYKDDQVWKAVTSGQGRIKNALTMAITTASGKRAGFLWDWYSNIIKGGDPNCYCYWVGLDDGDNMKNKRTWRKVMISPRITQESLEDQLADLGAATFERYQLNRFPMEKAEEPFMRAQDIKACVRNKGEINKSKWFTVAVDGAVSGDTLAVVAAQPQEDGTAAFEEWIWDVTSAMGVYDLTDVADVLSKLAMEEGRPLIVCDPARLQFTSNWLRRERGIELYDFAQTPRMMAPASELLARHVKRHTACFNKTPTLAKHCENAIADVSKAYGRRISSKAHGKKSDRIDAAVAAAMALSAYDENLDEHTGSCGVWSIEL
jgi:phage terminase large subunit-like protein